MKNTHYLVSGADYYPSPKATVTDYLPNKVFVVKYDPKTGQPYLHLLQDEYTFGYKIYGKDKWFVDRVINSWQNTKSNLGVLLNGIKGTGKTVTAELIANAADTPVIVVTEFDESLISLLSEIDQNIVVLLDEYEKVFKDSHFILSLMDGTLNTQYKKLFILTTNEKKIDANLLERPSRIRYVREYTSLDKTTILEIIDDILKDTSKKPAILELLTSLGIITIDLVKSIVNEVNMYGDEPSKYREFFNLGATQEDEFSVSEEVEGQLQLITPNLYSMSPSDIRDYDDWNTPEYPEEVKEYLHDSLYFLNQRRGIITKITVSDNRKEMVIHTEDRERVGEAVVEVARKFVIARRPFKHKNMS